VSARWAPTPYTTPSDYLTIAYDTATGTRIWHSREGIPGQALWPMSVESSPDGQQLYVTGTGPTVAYDSNTGGRLWEFSDPDFFANSLSVDPGGAGLYVTGAQGIGPKMDLLTAGLSTG